MDGPRELDELTAGLIGAELYRVLHEEHRGLRFDQWFTELVDAAAERAREGVPAALWLLFGLASIGTSTPAASAAQAAERSWPHVAGEVAVPQWLTDTPRVTATGAVHRMRDTYGDRFAVIAEYSYGHGRDPFAYLFDIDAAGIVRLAGAGVFDDVDQAAEAWRTGIGAAAGDARPRPVRNPEELLPLLHCDLGQDLVIGDETRAMMDNWFRAERRLDDLVDALDENDVPVVKSLYVDIDVTPMTGEFTTWYTDRHGTPPDAEALADLADEWMDGSPPETWFTVSPARIAHLLALMSDWVQDDPITLAVRTLLPDWVTWLADRANLPEPLREPLRQALE